MADAGDWPWELLDALDAAAGLAHELHPDLCPVWAGEGCSCGVPGMLVAVRDRVFAQAGDRLADARSRNTRDLRVGEMLPRSPG